jgi:hypothetical protein
VDAEGRVLSLRVDHHNGRYFDSGRWNGPPDVPSQFLRALERSERGRIGRWHVATGTSPSALSPAVDWANVVND